MPFHLLILMMLAVALFAQAASAAQDTNSAVSSEWLARVWQTEDGLPDNNITGLAQSADGFLWVATLGGLTRFDGARFEEFSLAQLPDVPSGVRKMYQDRAGQFWLVNPRGTVMRVGSQAARVFENEGFRISRVSTIAEDAEGAVWFAGGGKICSIQGDRLIVPRTEDGLPQGGSWWLASDVHGTLWFARGAQLGLFRNGRWQTLLAFPGGSVRLARSRSGGVWVYTASRILKIAEGSEPEEIARLSERVVVEVMLEDHSGVLWIGTAAHGLLRIHGRQVQHLKVSHSQISALLEDREGNLWVGTAGGGLNRLRPKIIDLQDKAAGLPFESVRSVCQDSNGVIWAVLQNGVLTRKQPQGWGLMTEAEGWPAVDATCVVPAQHGGVWVGTRSRGVLRWQAGKLLDPEGTGSLANNSIRSLLLAANGDLWIATASPSRLSVLKGKETFELSLPTPVRSIRALAETPGGMVWAGTSDGLTLRANGVSLTNQVMAQEERPPSVRCLRTTPDGSLWIGYAGAGLGIWRGGTYARITTAHGLDDDSISQILEDDRGNLWLAGGRGLFQVQLQELEDVLSARRPRLRSRVFGVNESLPNSQFICENSPAAWKAADGRLWFSTRNGLLVVDPDKVRDNPEPPPVLLTLVKADDHPVARRAPGFPQLRSDPVDLLDLTHPGARLALAPRHRKLEFEFTALSFSSPENVQFRCRLKGFDEDWGDVGTQRSVMYPRLPAGHYQFEVTACNEAGVWNEAGAVLPFVVQPFFWQTWWFRLTVLGGFTTGIIFLARYFSFRRLRRQLGRLERQSELQKERARIARDMHDEVGAKLSRLSLLSDLAGSQSDMPPAAQREVREISEAARETIRSFEEVVWAVNPRNDSVAPLVHYLCRFTEEYFDGTDLQCAFEIPEQIPPVELSTETRHHVFLTAKEALHNVLKHAKARHVRLRFGLDGGRFELRIQDDGCGFDPTRARERAGGGNGLANMRERMREVGGRLTVQSQPLGGTQVVISAPCSSSAAP